MVTDGTIMTSSLDIIGLCTESILVVMVEEDMVSLSACPLLNRVLVRVVISFNLFLIVIIFYIVMMLLPVKQFYQGKSYLIGKIHLLSDFFA